MDSRRTRRNSTVCCGIEEMPNLCNPTEYRDFVSAEILCVWKRKFDEIHSKPNCTEMSFWHILISKRHFSVDRFRMYFIEFSFLNKRNLRMLWDSDMFCGITGIWRLFNPTTNCEIAMFWPGVYRAPCHMCDMPHSYVCHDSSTWVI